MNSQDKNDSLSFIKPISQFDREGCSSSSSSDEEEEENSNISLEIESDSMPNESLRKEIRRLSIQYYIYITLKP